MADQDVVREARGRRAVSLARFCEEREISLRTGWSLVAEGKLRVARFGRCVRVLAEDAAAFDAAAREGGAR